jgi:hypothetical protein
MMPYRCVALVAVLAAAAPAAAQLRFDRGGLFIVGPQPTAVATGDVNLDGVADVFCLNRTFDRLSLALGSFDPVTHDWVGTAVPGDATGGSGGGGGYGSGGGSGPSGPPGFVTPTEPVDLVVADFNRDGVSDVLVVGRAGRTVSLRLGRMTGTLGPESRTQLPFAPFRVRAADLDDDGNLDAVVATPQALYVSFGSTAAPLLPPVAVHAAQGSQIAGFDVADADGDGRLDLVVMEQHPGGALPASARVLHGDGTGLFAAEDAFEVHPALTLLVDVLVADLDANGSPELIVASYPTDLFIRPLGAGLPSIVSTTNTEVAIDVADFDRDGLPDVVSSSSGTFDSMNVYLADGRGGLEVPLRFQIGSDPRRFAIGDIDGDLRPDVVTTTAGMDPSEPGAFELYLDRSGSFRDAGTVNAGVGPLADVLYVNGTTGGPQRRVSVRLRSALRVDLLAPPAADRPAPFAIFGWEADPMRGPGAALPNGIGDTCLPTPLSPGSPQPTFGWNSSRRTGIAPYLRECGPAPCVLLNLKRGLRRPATFFLQGVIADSGSAAERFASVTNGVLVDVR